MASADGLQSIEISEHIDPVATGDNIGAKRAASYGFGANSNWGRTPLPLVDLPYDSTNFSNPDGAGNYQTVTFLQGGLAGTVVRTLNLSYDGNNNITSIARI